VLYERREDERALFNIESGGRGRGYVVLNEYTRTTEVVVVPTMCVCHTALILTAIELFFVTNTRMIAMV
jgi:hypothetical protein